jgi:hypothetical protein
MIDLKSEVSKLGFMAQGIMESLSEFGLWPFVYVLYPSMPELNLTLLKAVLVNGGQYSILQAKSNSSPLY